MSLKITYQSKLKPFVLKRDINSIEPFVPKIEKEIESKLIATAVSSFDSLFKEENPESSDEKKSALDINISDNTKIESFNPSRIITRDTSINSLPCYISDMPLLATPDCSIKNQTNSKKSITINNTKHKPSKPIDRKIILKQSYFDPHPTMRLVLKLSAASIFISHDDYFNLLELRTDLFEFENKSIAYIKPVLNKALLSIPVRKKNNPKYTASINIMQHIISFPTNTIIMIKELDIND
jgi:hypothetical protein